MNVPLTVECPVHFRGRGPGSRQIVPAAGKRLSSASPPTRVPRIARLMALALRFEELIRTGEVADYAELARLGQVSRARITQLMNLLVLAPSIQEELLFLAEVGRGRDPIHLRQLPKECVSGRTVSAATPAQCGAGPNADGVLWVPGPVRAGCGRQPGHSFGPAPAGAPALLPLGVEPPPRPL